MPRTSTSRTVGSRQPLRLDDYVGHLLRRAHLISSAVTATYIRDADLTPPQLATLLKLMEVEQASQNELGRLVAMERANIHRLVDRLVERGLVTATKDPADARKMTLCVSGKGRRLVERVEPLHRQSMVDTMEVLNAKERVQFLRLLKKFCGISDP